MSKSEMKRKSIHAAGVYDSQASNRDADVIIKNSELTKLRNRIEELEAALIQAGGQLGNPNIQDACASACKTITKVLRGKE
jgi:hypothetical protein